MVLLTTGLMCKVTCNSRPGYEASYLLTSNLQTILLKQAKPLVARSRKTQKLIILMDLIKYMLDVVILT